MDRNILFYFAVVWVLRFVLGTPIWLNAIILPILHLLGGYDHISVIVRTSKRDFVALYRYIKLLFWMRKFQHRNLTIPMVFENFVREHPQKACYIFEDKVWTFKMVSELSNRVAHVFEDAGFKPGDTVALMMDNRPEYVAIWLGLAKAGLVTALINYNLQGDVLAHSIRIANSKAVIFSSNYTQVVDQIRDKIDSSVAYYAFDVLNSTANWSKNLDKALAESSTNPLSGPQRANSKDKMLYIYTSGTTGLPKAAVIRHSRYALFASSVHYMTNMRHEDVIYITLPLYHSAGGMTGLGQNLHFGCTAVLRKKFSVSAFWSEASRHNCTLAIYIGEICRYLLAAPSKPEEQQHKIRMMYGNGMRPQIWDEFVKRFNVPVIAELYGATEGISNIINYEGVSGAVGFMSRTIPSFYPIALIRVDEDGVPIRDEKGLCIRCQPFEPGMYVGLITPDNAMRSFDGYVDQEATKKKVARDVFRRGDAAFLSGDILEMDELGYLYFKDRTGDTFRWRGENVSTTEVEAVISNVAGLKDCAVYGVEVPGSEGRAGMAAILDPDGTLDVKNLAQGLAKVLPTYARPLFIRVVNTIELTGTYKLRKVDYQKESFHLDKVQDAVYLLDSKSQSYVPFTAELYDQLKSGAMRI